MMRALVFLVAVFLGHGAMAQGWSASIGVTGAETFSGQSSGERNSYTANQDGAYFVADTFAEASTCGAADAFEVDYFFGVAEAWEAQILFTMERNGNGFTVADPAMFVSTLDKSDQPDQTYYGNTGFQVDVTSLKCRSDGRFQMAIRFQGPLSSEQQNSNGRVNVTGASDAVLGFQDHDDY